MKNLWLVVCQLVLSLITLVVGVWLAQVVFADDLPALVVDLIYLLSFLSPFLWYMGVLDKREAVDSLFVLEQVLWHMILFVAAYNNKEIVFGGNGNMFLALIVLVAFLGLRSTTQDSFLKQER